MKTISTQRTILRFFMALLGMAILSILTSCRTDGPIPDYEQTYEELKTIGLNESVVYADTFKFKLQILPTGDTVAVYTEKGSGLMGTDKLFVFKKENSFKAGTRFYLQD